MFLSLVAIVLLDVAGRSMATSNDLEKDADLYKRLYDFGLGKRAAYSYVSEYKRLPVYNFGLGKRSADSRMYSFGVGKRAYDFDDEYDEDEAAAAGAGKGDFSKRSKQYGFGLGKRLPARQYSFGLGKRPEGKMYAFGLGKRTVLDYGDYDSSLDDLKRSAPSRFAFGIGKRGDSEPRQGRSMMYGFGLGKRNLPEQDKESVHPVFDN